MAMVVKANRLHPGRRRRPGRAHLELRFAGDHVRYRLQPLLARRKSPEHGGDLLYIQGHSSPGIYARAFMEGRLTEEQLLNFRQEVDGKGISSYPHPKLMPEFWQFPTVSMGLGPLMAIYQARFLKYLHARGIADTEQAQGLGLLRRRRDGRAGIAGRHRTGRPREAGQPDLRHQLQPAAARRSRCAATARSSRNSKREFRGSGWNVIKLIWGSYWDPLLARDKDETPCARS